MNESIFHTISSLKRNIVIGGTILVSIFYLFVLIDNSPALIKEIFTSASQNSSDIFIYFPAISMFIMGVVVLFNWLTPKTPRKESRSLDGEGIDIQKLEDQLSYGLRRIEKEINEKFLSSKENVTKIEFSEHDRNQILNSLQKEIKEKLTDDVISGIKESSQKSYMDKYAENLSKESVSRLNSLSNGLEKRSAINLISGIFFAALGIALIFSGIDGGPSKTIGEHGEILWADLGKYYLPRGGMVILIEIVAFFFLKLYRRTLDEIKYVHNELTNIESRLIALGHAVRSDDTKLISACVQALMKTERNFVLKKGETTVELEHARAESSLARDLIKESGGLFKALSGRGKSEASDT